METKLSRPVRRFGLLAALAAAAVTVGGTPSTARADDAPACPSSGRIAYALDASALTGKTQTDVSVKLRAAPGCPAVSGLKLLQVRSFAANGSVQQVRNLTDVALTDGAATIALDRVARGQAIEANALVQGDTLRRTYVARAATTSLLRPDLVVQTVRAPRQALTTRPFDVVAEIAEGNGDVGADVHVVLAGPLGPIGDPLAVNVPARGRVEVTFHDVALAEDALVQVKVLVADAAPGEYDTGNNDRAAAIEMTKNELTVTPPRVLVESLGGYGFQFNQHLYAAITNPPPETLPDLEAKVKALEPQMVRIFFNDNWELNANQEHPEWAENLASFEKTVQLANESGASILIAYQTVTSAKSAPTTWMKKFADVLQDLVQTHGFGNVDWVTIGNEPNSISASQFSTTQYEALYRALDAELKTRGLRTEIGLVGGDLVQNTEGTAGGHRAWFDYMTTHMNDVIDAWSEHIYWQYDDPFRMESRLKDVAHLVHEELPAEARKPIFIMEYGVRGTDTCGTKPLVKFAYYKDANCTELRRLSIAGFQKLWFSVEAAQLGFDAVANWDLYWSVYDKTKGNQSFWIIGPPEEGWALYPSYYALQLLLQTTARGWQVVGLDPWNLDDEATPYNEPHRDTAEQELVAYSGPDGQLTMLGLDTNGRALVAPSGGNSTYSIGDLPASTTFHLVLWNATGDGTTSVSSTVVSNAVGVVRFEVPLQAAFALTTVPVS